MTYKQIKKILLTTLFTWLIILPFNLSCFANETKESNEIKPTIERHFVFDTIPMNLKEMIRKANRIFAGKCTNVKYIQNDPESNLPVYKYTFKIIEEIKGLRNKKEITFTQWAAITEGSGYEVGNKYVLLLYPDSELGLTSPIGIGQGKFTVERAGIIRRREVVQNQLSNKGLSRNLKTQKKISILQDKYINNYVHRCSELGIGIRYQEFIQAVKYLAKEE